MNVFDAILVQQEIWRQEGVLYDYLVKQLDSFGRSRFIFGQDFLF